MSDAGPALVVWAVIVLAIVGVVVVKVWSVQDDKEVSRCKEACGHRRFLVQEDRCLCANPEGGYDKVDVDREEDS